MEVYVVYTSGEDYEGYSSPQYAATTQEAAIRWAEQEVATYYVGDSGSFVWRGGNDTLWYSSPDYWAIWWVLRLPVEVV